MILPPTFEKDLQSKVLNIITRVVIGGENKIYLSTHNINFDGNYHKPLLLNIPSMIESIDHESRNFRISNVSLSISNYEFNGERFSDSLRDRPLINEEINIYWQTQSAINSDDTLQIFKGYVRRVSHTDSAIKIELEDLTQLKLHKSIPLHRTSGATSVGEKHRDVPIPMAFGYLDNAYAVLDSGQTLKADSDESVELVEQGVENYEPHPIWGEFNFYDRNVPSVFAPYEHGISPVKMFIDSQAVYIPLTVGRALINEASDEDVESPVDHIQYDSSGGYPVLNPFSFLKNDGRETKALQGILLSKPSDISCHFRSSSSLGNHDGIREEGGTPYSGEHGWGTPNRFEPRTVEKLTDDSYDSHDLSSNEMNGYDPYSSYSSANGNNFNYFHNTSEWEFGGTSAQGLMRVKILSTPEVGFFAQDIAQFAINGVPLYFRGWIHNYIFSRTITASDFGALHAGWGVDPEPEYMVTFFDSFYLDGNWLRYGGNIDDDNASGGELSEDDIGIDFRDLFEFTYGGDSDTHDNYRGYDTSVEGAIQIKEINLTETDISSGEDYWGNSWASYEGNENPRMVSPFIRFCNFSKEWGEISMNLGAYCRDMVEVEAGFDVGLGGAWKEIDLAHTLDVEFTNNSEFFLSVNGRTEGGEVIYNPITIMRNIAINELGLDEESQIDNDSYLKAMEAHDGLKFAFSIKKEIESKKLFEEMAKSTLCYPYFNNSGKLTFASYKESYQTSDYDSARVIKDVDIFSFSFDKTKAEQAHTLVTFSYGYNYVTGKYDKILDSGLYPSDSELAYNGYETTEDNILEFKSPYIRDYDTAEKVRKWMFRFYKNQHLTCKLKLPLHYIDIEVGDTIRFDKLLGGMKAFGIDYTKVTNPNSAEGIGQDYYPLFFVTSVIKSLDNIDIDAQQIHWIGGGSISEWGDLVEGDIVEPEEEEEIEEGEVIASFTIDPDSSNSFYTLEELYSNAISNWIEPISWGLDSFDSLVPTDWTSYTANEIRDYEALHLSIAYEMDGTFQRIDFILKNISNSTDANDFELGWEHSVELDMGETVEDWFGQYEGDGFRIIDVHMGYAPSNKRHKAFLGDGLKKAFDNNLLGFEEITFTSWYPIMMSTGGHGLGDVTGDGVINILDIVVMVNAILGQTEWEDQAAEDAADANQDGTVNILDIVVLVNYILGSGDLG